MAALDSPLELPSAAQSQAPQPTLPYANGAPETATATTTTLVAGGDMDALGQYPDVEARCGGCKEIIDQDNGGIVVAFGQSLWHVDCFRCAKCKGKVSADTNLLLLSDGNPVCGNCSYQCFVCKQAITEEAIMTGDESYHAHCFTCRTCKRRIDELVFAKTSQGIYCMSCHNERVARSRRHAEAKLKRAARKEKEREEAEARKRAGLSTSSTSTSLNVLANAMSPGSPSSASTERGMSPRASGQQAHSSASDATMRAASPVPRTGSPAHSRGGSVPPSPAVEQQPMARERSADSRTARSNTASPTPGPSSTPQQPNANGLGFNASQSSSNLAASGESRFSNSSNTRSPTGGVGLGVSGLGVPTSKAEKRRSINPGMTFNMDGANNTFAAEPRAPSPLRASFIEQQQTIPPPRSSSAASPIPTTPTPAPQSTVQAEPVPSPALSPTISKTPTPLPQSPVLTTPATPAGLDFSPPKTDESSKTSDSSPAPKTVDASPVPRAVDQSLSKEQQTANGDTPLPKILPTMSFSLSDPDFAVLLKEMEATGKTPEALQGLTGKDLPSTPKPAPDSEANSAASAASDSEVDTSTNATGLPRSSKTMNLLSTVANGGDADSLLSPNNQASTVTLRRRASKESIVSVRVAPDSSFQALADSVSSLTPGEDGKVAVEHVLLLEAIREHQELKETLATLKAKYTGAKRSSQQYSDGLTVAGEEYDKEVAMRRELEAEVIRLRAQVHGQTARLSVISSDERRAESMRRQSQDLASNLSGLERDISRLRAQRDISLAEVEELYAKRANAGEISGSPEETSGQFGRSLTRRLDTIKEQYSSELGPLSAQREALQNEINDLRETREQLLEESAALAAKNDDLSELNASLTRATENMQDTLPIRRLPANVEKRVRGHPSGSPSMSSIATALHDVPEETKETARVIKVSKPEPIESAPVRRFKWMGKKNAQDAVGAMGAAVAAAAGGAAGKKFRQADAGHTDHQFQQHGTMRLGRCELCNDKMWGLQEVKCAACGIVCHSKCADKQARSCPGKPIKEDDGPVPPSMFGRDLTEQAVSDGASVPVIVTKCIRAVEANGMEYEGIYRKTGGSSQSKQITQLFERGQYDRFDLTDLESFNDISSITSVLKTYFRQLPNPLLTHALHESFVAAANIRDQSNKHQALCALLAELPSHHYNTLKVLMLHLNRVTAKSDINLMTSQNLGVVFGPTLLRSADPNREFGDMAGKALSVQWMVENAPKVFMEDKE